MRILKTIRLRVVVGLLAFGLAFLPLASAPSAAGLPPTVQPALVLQATVPVSASSRIIIFGDSITFGFGASDVPWVRSFYPAMDTLFGVSTATTRSAAVGGAATTRTHPAGGTATTRASIPASQRAPEYTINGGAGLTYHDMPVGSTFGDIAGYSKTLRSNLTHVFIYLGINDAAAINAGTLTTNNFTSYVTTVVNSAVSLVGGSMIVCIGPSWHSDSGVRGQIPTVIAIIQPICTGVGGTFVDLSSLTDPNDYVDGVHFKASGALKAANLVLAAIQRN